jgi:hypothetical protein
MECMLTQNTLRWGRLDENFLSFSRQIICVPTDPDALALFGAHSKPILKVRSLPISIAIIKPAFKSRADLNGYDTSLSDRAKNHDLSVGLLAQLWQLA